MDDVVDARLEIAFGAVPSDDPSRWVFVNVTDDLLPDAISITRGRQDEAAHVAPSACRLALDNQNSAYTPNHPASPYYPDVTLGAPLRVTVPAGYTFLTTTRDGAASTPDRTDRSDPSSSRHCRLNP
ncbi:MAG: hypothetical protein JWQ81_863 [Amycolatopsis sp.]|uniref:hypothetical protein n=1 Tax=Amycolatopsis sp. TaxID=37632 RepID=UPI0026181E83|nr:hypothetical protein [Amycolatopsis sp.]MCU1680124.1 hypothetical protein [Amycolatopsis sp.]